MEICHLLNLSSRQIPQIPFIEPLSRFADAAFARLNISNLQTVRPERLWMIDVSSSRKSAIIRADYDNDLASLESISAAICGEAAREIYDYLHLAEIREDRICAFRAHSAYECADKNATLLQVFPHEASI